VCLSLQTFLFSWFIIDSVAKSLPFKVEHLKGNLENKMLAVDKNTLAFHAIF
jgi:hypothetical protein